MQYTIKLLILAIGMTSFSTTTLSRTDIPHQKNPAYVWDRYGQIVRDQFGQCVRTREWKEDTESCGGKAAVKAVLVTPPPKAAPAPAPKPEPKIAPAPAPIPKPIIAVPIAAKVAEPEIVVSETPMNFSGFFENNKIQLKSAAKKQLNGYATYLRNHPGKKLTITGHTDSRGKASYNQNLSKRRAESVKSYLESKGIDPNRLMTDGKGQTSPIADNATAAGRAENRRVELKIID